MTKTNRPADYRVSFQAVQPAGMQWVVVNYGHGQVLGKYATQREAQARVQELQSSITTERN